MQTINKNNLSSTSKQVAKALSDPVLISYQQSIILNGSVFQATVRLAVPVLISLVFSFLYNTVDTFFVSMIDRHSTAFVSGVSLISPLFFLFNALSNGIRVGISTLVARSVGEKNKVKKESIFFSGLVIAIFLVIFTLVIGYLFINDIIRLLAGKSLSPAAIDAATDYFFYMLPGFGLMILGQVFIGMLWGEGLTIVVGVILIISNLLNIIIDPFFIFLLKMETGGAGLATTLSLAFTALIVLYLFVFRKSTDVFHFNFSYIRKKILLEISKIGFSQVFSIFSFALAFILFNNLIGSLGQQELNSWGLCNRLDQFIFLPLFAISAAQLVMIGQNYGAGNLDKVKKIYRLNIFYAVTCMGILSAIYIIFAPSFYRLFSDVQAVINGSVLQVRIITFSFLAVAIELLSTSTFLALGRPVPAFILGFIRMFFFAIPLSYLAVYKLSFGVVGIFVSICIAQVSTGFISYLWVNHVINKMKKNWIEPLAESATYTEMRSDV